MSLPYPISSTQTDAKSPVDDNLMDSIRLDLEYLDSVAGGGSGPTSGIVFNADGSLGNLNEYRAPIDTSFVSGPFVPSTVKYSLKRGGVSGSLKFQIIKKANTTEYPIRETFSRFQANIQAITRTQTALNIQAIARAEPTQSTQNIVYAYADRTVVHVLNMGDGRTQYVLSSAVSADWKVGDTVIITGCTNSANNGRFVIVAINQGNKPCIVVTHSGSVTETTSGSVNLTAFRYETTNPIAWTLNVENAKWVMASHSSSANNGTFSQYAANVGGNGPVIKNPNGVTQSGAAGSVALGVWRYSVDTFTSARLAAGEKIFAAGCSNASNDGTFPVLQSSGSVAYIDVLNLSGAAQASAAGTVNLFLWSYALDADPTTNLTAITHKVTATGATNSLNNVSKAVVRERVNSPSDVVVVYNESGLTQGSAGGVLTSTTRLVEFETNLSSLIRVDDYIEIDSHIDESYNQDYIVGPFKVLAVNQLGGFNAEIEIEGEIVEWAGMVSQVLYGITPEITYTPSPIGDAPKRYLKFETTSFLGDAINSNDIVFLYIKSSDIEDAEDLTVIIK